MLFLHLLEENEEKYHVRQVRGSEPITFQV